MLGSRKTYAPSGVVGSGVEPMLHRAARIEDALHAFRERNARRRGQIPTIVPYSGYGGPGWIRILCRVLLTKEGERRSNEHTHVRGWRSFTSVPIDAVVVEAVIDGVDAPRHGRPRRCGGRAGRGRPVARLAHDHASDGRLARQSRRPSS